MGTAYPALFLTAAALLLGSFNVLWRKANPASFDLRRDLGIWAGILALVHTGVGLNVHLRGKMWLYFVDTHYQLRRDAFGFGNYTGAVAVIVFLLLLALSNDLSLRKLGIDRWKSLQRWAYAGIANRGEEQRLCFHTNLCSAEAVGASNRETSTIVFQRLHGCKSAV